MTRRTRTVLAAVTLWLVIVGGTSTVAWVVIDRAGRGVFITDAGGAPEPSSPTSPVATDPPTTGTHTGAPPQSHTSTSSGTASSTRPSPRPSPRPPSSAPSTRSSTPEGGTTSPPPLPAPSPTVSDSVTVSGGTVGVNCQGSTISLRYVTPRNGWSFELDRSNRKIEVKFSQQHAEGEAEVHATCSGGRPVFETASGDGDRTQDTSSPGGDG